MVSELGIGMRRLPGRSREGGGSAAGQQEQLVRGARSSRGDGGGHVVHGAEGDCVELAGGGHGFDAGRPDLCSREVEGADGFAEERGLFVLRFGQGDLDVGAEEGDGQAGEASPGAEVEEGGGAGVQVWRAAKRLSPKWRRTISSGSRMAVRLVRAFHLRRRSR